MASYYPIQILPPRKKYGFIQGLSEGLPKASNLYAQSMLKNTEKEKKKKEAEKNISKVKEWAEQQGIDMEESISFDSEGNVRRTLKPKKGKKLSYEDVVKKAVGEEISWEDVNKEYPTKYTSTEKTKKRFTPVEKSPEFTKGTGTPISRLKSYFSESQAEISKETQKVIDNIKTEADLEELIKNKDDYEEAGVDVKAILEYFGKK